jgi:hypothetical protein
MEIMFNEVKLKVYENGIIERQFNNGWKKIGTIHILKNYKCIVIKINKKQYLSSRIIAFVYLGLDINNKMQFIDHIDQNPINNNLSNLRIVTNQQNQFNTKAKGYYFCKKYNKWISQIKLNYKLIRIGSYNTEQEAKDAYLIKKIELHII